MKLTSQGSKTGLNRVLCRFDVEGDCEDVFDRHHLLNSKTLGRDIRTVLKRLTSRQGDCLQFGGPRTVIIRLFL